MFHLLNLYFGLAFEIRKQQSEIALPVLFNAFGNAFFHGRVFPKGIITGGLSKGLKST